MDFDIEDFLPYLLNRAAESSSASFQQIYKTDYGMLRTEWRVLFHLGYYKEMTASQICQMADLHKTKVSRAVSALEEKRFIERIWQDDDRRVARLSLTSKGRSAYDELCAQAAKFHNDLMADFTSEEQDIFMDCLRRIRGMKKRGIYGLEEKGLF